METAVLSDEILVVRARQGDRNAFGALVSRYQSQAVSMAQSILRNYELAKDASQSAFAKAYFALNRFQGEAKFKTWLFRIVINEAKDTYRREKARGLFRFWSAGPDEEGDSMSVLEVIPSPDASPREVYESNEAKARLERAIYSLPDREREVFIMRYLNGFAIDEVARALGIAVGTVKAHLSHGTEKLRTILLIPTGGAKEGERHG